MKLLCPNCNSLITRDNVNLRTSICYCTSCDEFFKVSEFLSPFQQLQEAEKPSHTKWSVQQMDSEYVVSRQPSGWSGANITLFCIAVFSLPFFAFSEPEIKPWSFLVLCLTTLSFIYYFNLKHEVIISSNELLFIKRVFKYNWIKRRAYTDWERVRVETEDREDAKVYSIRLYFSKSEPVSLPEGKELEEQQWLAKELYKIKDECALERAKAGMQL
ncbi:hypothetical protein [Desertivirga arenae]|uniref:hypothetical protein n=1 Tax=Desertivirga arenae TaxID=2810309 RepID=UPI001A979EAE|nr:hypothetical protein [Pedobacter sp. SYSU D00823]